MGEVDPRLEDVTFNSAELVKLFAATYLPLCDLLDSAGVVDRTTIADTMGLYVQPGEKTASAMMIEAMCRALRRPAASVETAVQALDGEPAPRAKPDLNLIRGGRS